MKIQRRIKNQKRDRLYASALHKIAREVEHLAAKFNCSKSFVIATALADTFGIDVEHPYEVSKTHKNTHELRRVI